MTDFSGVYVLKRAERYKNLRHANISTEKHLLKNKRVYLNKCESTNRLMRLMSSGKRARDSSDGVLTWDLPNQDLALSQSFRFYLWSE